MKPLWQLTPALLALVLCLTAKPSADEVSVTIVVTTAPQNGPLQITGFKLPDKVGGEPILVLHNVSHKEIRSFGAEAAVGNPDESGRAEVGGMVAVGNGSEHIYWPHEQIVSPNGYREAHENVLRSHNLAEWGQRLHSSCLHVAPIVTYVEFTDGSRWELKTPQDEAIWKASLRDDSTKSCGHSSTVEYALRQWEGAAGYVGTGTPSHQSADAVRSYSIVCPLRMVGTRLTALCPW